MSVLSKLIENHKTISQIDLLMENLQKGSIKPIRDNRINSLSEYKVVND